MMTGAALLTSQHMNTCQLTWNRFLYNQLLFMFSLIMMAITCGQCSGQSRKYPRFVMCPVWWPTMTFIITNGQPDQFYYSIGKISMRIIMRGLKLLHVAMVLSLSNFRVLRWSINSRYYYDNTFSLHLSNKLYWNSYSKNLSLHRGLWGIFKDNVWFDLFYNL